MKLKKTKMMVLVVLLMASLFISCDSNATKPEPITTATVTINLISNHSVAGVTVVLENNNGNPNNVYTRTAANNTVNFVDIPFGYYAIKITHVNYRDYFYGDLAVQSSAISHQANLFHTNLSAGDIITFGAYEWRVLDIEDGRALVVSRNIIESRAYHTSYVSITWADSSLRAYLNGEFYNSFSASDRARIIQVTNVNENNQWYGTNGGADTQDKIFLLSIAEVVKYFGDSGQLANRPLGASAIFDEYNQNRIATFNGTISWWWLRSPGSYSGSASGVSGVGSVSLYGYAVSNHSGVVRPALWLNL